MELPPQPDPTDFDLRANWPAYYEALRRWERVCKLVIESQRQPEPIACDRDDEIRAQLDALTVHVLELGERAALYFAEGTRTGEPLDVATALKCLAGAMGALEAQRAPVCPGPHYVGPVPGYSVDATTMGLRCELPDKHAGLHRALIGSLDEVSWGDMR